MLNNKKATLLIAFILAVALWFYVVGEMNPTTRKTYRDIPVTLANEQTLTDNMLAVRRVSDEKMRVTVSGKRDAINALSKTDVVATCDLANAAEGTNKLPVELKIPENIEIDNTSLDHVEVNVENYVTEPRKIKVVYDGTLSGGGKPKTVKVDPKEVQVSGASSLVARVSYILANVPADELTEELSSTTSNLTAVNKNGNEVSRVTLSEQSCIVTARAKAKSKKEKKNS